MANKALNQVSQVQSTELANVKTFLAVMNNGEIKQMSKEDMSAVVGGLLSISKLLGISNTEILGEVDFNSITGLGIYRISTGEFANFPSDANKLGSILLVIPWDENTIYQFLVSMNQRFFLEQLIRIG